MKTTLLALCTVFALTLNAATYNAGSPSTTNNDDSCDIAVLPAATLLLPYFEVDVSSPQTVARTTLFTIVNTSHAPQIARVTVWTDLGYPIVDFNLFLTGYDVQAINLFDVLARGLVAPSSGTSSATPPGSRSLPNNGNPNFAPTAASDCVINPGPIPAALATDIRNALTLGRASGCGNATVGLTHVNAIGFVTIDVVKTCNVTYPDDEEYYDDLLFDNVLTGDYQYINPNAATGNYASGNPLVHIRAIPEGGPAGAVVATNLPYTFYDRFTPRATPSKDRRQPLPSTFAARFIQGGTGAFNTNFQIWREGVTAGEAACADYAKNVGSAMTLADEVRFDEHENASLISNDCRILCVPAAITLPESSSTSTSSSLYPPMLGVDVGGWMYLNLNNAGSTAYSRPRASQNWVSVTMFAEGRYSVSTDALMLGNGCSPPTAANAVIGPAGNTNP